MKSPHTSAHDTETTTAEAATSFIIFIAGFISLHATSASFSIAVLKSSADKTMLMLMITTNQAVAEILKNIPITITRRVESISILKFLSSRKA